MKKIYMLGNLSRNYLSPLMILLSFTYFMIVCVGNTIGATRGMSNSLFDYIVNLRGGGSCGNGLLLFGILPILALLLPLLMDRMENEMIITRLQNKRALLYEHFLFSIGISVIFTSLMALVGIVVAFVETGKLTNLWGTKEGMLYFLLDNKSTFSAYLPHVTSGKIWLYVLASRFLAVLFMAMFIIFLKLVLKKNIYVLFVSLVLFASDGYVSTDTPIFIKKIDISIDTWLKSNDQLFNLIYFIVWIVLLFLISMKQYDKKEFYH
ncbi:hypothetical protein M3215_22990 [Bacillus cytotoxicus]|uniref:Uncharacterized protein n=1 Tax=Bacillus cytotoxicus TaxID=580165 RepID=A0ACC6ADI8_9BACI|nr:hypothetical protein [Bacillus cytotoxicus]